MLVRVTADGARTSEFNQGVNWGRAPLPPVFVDLPTAVRIARNSGMKGLVNRARLDIWSPAGAPAVLAWMIGDKTVNGATGEIIAYDVTGYIKSYTRVGACCEGSARAVAKRTRRIAEQRFPRHRRRRQLSGFGL